MDPRNNIVNNCKEYNSKINGKNNSEIYNSIIDKSEQRLINLLGLGVHHSINNFDLKKFLIEYYRIRNFVMDGGKDNESDRAKLSYLNDVELINTLFKS